MDLINNLLQKAYELDKLYEFRIAEAIDEKLIKLAQEDPNNDFTKEYDIAESNLPVLDKLVEKINNKIKNLNRKSTEQVQYTTYKIIKHFNKEIEADQAATTPLAKVIPMVTVEITGTKPSLNGWHFVARILHGFDDENKPMNTFLGVPGESVPDSYKAAGPDCEHCFHKRKRLDTFIVRNDKNQYKQVGSTCLQDFLNTRDIHGAISLLDYYNDFFNNVELLDTDERSPRARSGYSTKQALALITALTLGFGYVSKKTSEIRNTRSTSDVIRSILNPPARGKELEWWREHNRKYLHYLQELTDTEKRQFLEFTEQAINYIKGMKDKENPSDFEWNLSATLYDVLNKGYVDPRRLGILSYFAGAYQRHLDQEKGTGETHEKQQVKKLSLPELQELYPVGSKIKETVTITDLKTLDSAYGITTLHTFRNEAGVYFKWFASGGVRVGKVEDVLEITGTVKKIEEYNGFYSVMLLRVKSLGIKSPTKEEQPAEEPQLTGKEIDEIIRSNNGFAIYELIHNGKIKLEDYFYSPNAQYNADLIRIVLERKMVSKKQMLNYIQITNPQWLQQHPELKKMLIVEDDGNYDLGRGF